MNPIPALGLLIILSACARMTPPEAVRASRDPSPSASVSRQDDSVARGAAFVQTNCSSCHAVGRAGDSAMPAAPRLRDLGRRYPVDQLAEAFAEGVVTAHPSMPEFVLTQDENRDLIAYLKSIQASDDG